MIPTSPAHASANAEAASTSPATSPTLATLKQVSVTPEWGTAKAPMKMLQSVVRVEVTKAAYQEDSTGKNQVYLVNVYMAHAEVKDKQQSGSCEPDFQVPHSIAQFCSLRNNVHACVQRGHKGSRCAFCEQLTRLVTFGQGEALSFAAVAFSPKTDASALLSGFLGEALRQSQQTLQSPGCRGQHQLQRLLQAFVFQ